MWQARGGEIAGEVIMALFGLGVVVAANANNNNNNNMHPNMPYTLSNPAPGHAGERRKFSSSEFFEVDSTGALPNSGYKEDIGCCLNS
jgi:hypothetical protein